MTSQSTLIGCNKHQSVLTTRTNDGQEQARVYTAYGYSPAFELTSLGFNGELPEPTGHYLLGSYRLYNPGLQRFLSPDSLSPFGKGGLNAYAYCLGDPINRMDPTGHIPQWGSLIAGVIGVAVGLLTGGIGSALGLVALAKKSLIGLAAISTTLGASSTGLDIYGRRKNDVGLQLVALGLAFLSGFAGGLAIGGRSGTSSLRLQPYSIGKGTFTSYPSPRSSKSIASYGYASPSSLSTPQGSIRNAGYLEVVTANRPGYAARADDILRESADVSPLLSAADPRIVPGYRPLPTVLNARFHRYWPNGRSPEGIGNIYFNI